MMRTQKISLFALMLAVVLMFAACKKKQQQPQGPQPTAFEQGMAAQDTADVKALIDKFFGYSLVKNYSEAAGMLCRNDHTEKEYVPEALNNEEMEKVRNMLKSIPMIGYEIEYIKFNEATENEVLCNVVIAEAHDDIPAIKTKMFFKPVRSSGQWYLCLMNSAYGDKGVVAPNKRDSVRKNYAAKSAAANGSNKQEK